MQVTVLGKSPAWQDAGGACSGYLVRHGAYTLLLDCGSGVFAKLREAHDHLAVDAVVISHMHADHFLDLIPYANALRYGTRRPPADRPPPALHLPPGGSEQLRACAIAGGGDADLVHGAFAVAEYDPDASLRAGALTLRFCAVPHFIAAHAVALHADGARLVFGADSGPTARLEAFGRDAELMLLEATLAEPPPTPNAEPAGHMTARQAGELGRRAGARRLVLTHYSDELDLARLGAEGAAGFGAPVELARAGAVYAV